MGPWQPSNKLLKVRGTALSILERAGLEREQFERCGRHLPVPQIALENILPCGGGSAMPGLNQRFLREMRALVQPSMQPKVG
jgi:hypothetical protein